jgi:hypothetical protein
MDNKELLDGLADCKLMKADSATELISRMQINCHTANDTTYTTVQGHDLWVTVFC